MIFGQHMYLVIFINRSLRLCHYYGIVPGHVSFLVFFFKGWGEGGDMHVCLSVCVCERERAGDEYG